VPEEPGSAATRNQLRNSQATMAAMTATTIQAAAGTPVRAALCGGGCTGNRASSAIAWRMAAAGAGRPAASSSVSNGAAAGSCAESMLTVRPLGIVARNCAVVGAESCVAATAGLARRRRVAFPGLLLVFMALICKRRATSGISDPGGTPPRLVQPPAHTSASLEFHLDLSAWRHPHGRTGVRQITGLRLDPRDVRHIVLTHLDFAHARGLDNFPHATAVRLLAKECDAAVARNTWLDRQDIERPRCTPGLRFYRWLMEKDRRTRRANQQRLRGLRELVRTVGAGSELFCLRPD